VALAAPASSYSIPAQAPASSVAFAAPVTSYSIPAQSLVAPATTYSFGHGGSAAPVVNVLPAYGSISSIIPSRTGFSAEASNLSQEHVSKIFPLGAPTSYPAGSFIAYSIAGAQVTPAAEQPAVAVVETPATVAEAGKKKSKKVKKSGCC